MRLPKLLFDVYVRASLHVSLSLVSLVAFTGDVFGLQISSHYYWALFLGSVAAYNTIKYGVETGKHLPGLPGGVRPLITGSLLALFLALYHLFFLPPAYWFLLMACGAISALYAVPFLPGVRNLRSFGLLKVFLVALVWTLASLWIPAWGRLQAGMWDLQVEGFQRILWIFLLMLPFEIRDLQRDPPSLRTIPQRWGVAATRRTGWAVALVFVLATWLKDSTAPGELLCKAVTGLLLGAALAGASERQGKYYASFWVEGIPIISWLLLRGLQEL
ncbi:hypothetical protein [Robiginitalea marina]|uniref:Prenyltransferase n=1 Tax=Robiginitalea marina TaxID=2954105 RepID=A0ABT1AYS6_9FLAO|nr:hypothetical protein [Robiginitalea marina]MCO5725194.1 hypothetical protein [Robiginitalea marina]